MARGTEKFVFALGACAAACAMPASAAEWSVTPAFSWDADHSTNRGLQPDAPESQSYGAVVDLQLARRDDTSEFRIQPHYRLARYLADRYPDADDKQLSMSGHWGYENAVLELNALAAEESTLTTELAETGLVRADSNRRTIGGGLAWKYAAAETRQLSLSLGWQDVDYTGARQDVLTGYRYLTASVGESFTLTPRAALLVTAFGSRLESPERNSTSDERGASLGVQYAWSERTTMSLSLGLSKQDMDGRQSTGTTRDFSLDHKGERLDWSLGYSHSLQPYGTGVLAERDTAQLQFVRALGPRLDVLLSGRYARNQDGGFGFTFDSREYRFGESSLRWRVRETWYASLSVGYSTARQEATWFTRASDAHGWTIGLNTRWTPRAIVIGH